MEKPEQRQRIKILALWILTKKTRATSTTFIPIQGLILSNVSITLQDLRRSAGNEATDYRCERAKKYIYMGTWNIERWGLTMVGIDKSEVVATFHTFGLLNEHQVTNSSFVYCDHKTCSNYPSSSWPKGFLWFVEKIFEYLLEMVIIRRKGLR